MGQQVEPSLSPGCPEHQGSQTSTHAPKGWQPSTAMILMLWEAGCVENKQDIAP